MDEYSDVCGFVGIAPVRKDSFFFFLIGVFCKERHLMDLILHMEEAAPFLFVVLFYFELMRIFVS